MIKCCEDSTVAGSESIRGAEPMVLLKLYSDPEKIFGFFQYGFATLLRNGSLSRCNKYVDFFLYRKRIRNYCRKNYDFYIPVSE
jgi:hypothetical protein